MHFRTIFRNIFSTWIAYAVMLFVGFVLAPFIVHHLGNTGYGIWVLIVSLTGYFGMLDLGLRQSVGRFVARYVGLNDPENVNRTVSSAMLMLASGGAIVVLATIAASLSFGIFKVGPQFQSSARIALLIGGMTIALGLPLSVFNAVLFALERFDVATSVTMCGAILRATLVVLALSHGRGLIALATIWLFCSMSEYCALMIFAKRLYRPLRISWRHASMGTCKGLFGFGVYRFLWIVSNQLIFYTDSVVIGIFLGAKAITFYAIAGSLVNYGRNVVSLAADTFAPVASRLDAKSDWIGLQKLQILGTRITLLIGLPMCLGFLFLGKQFIVLWMGSQYAVSALYLTVLTIPQFTSMTQYISAQVLVGMARHKVLAYIAFAEGTANLLLSIFLVRRIGLVGVAWGTAIPHLITTSVVIPIYTLRTLRMTWSTYIREGFVRPIVSAFPAAALCYVFSVVVVRPFWALFAAEVIAAAATVGLTSYFVCLTAQQRASLQNRVRGLVSPPWGSGLNLSTFKAETRAAKSD